jgi:hypothetical protein
MIIKFQRTGKSILNLKFRFDLDPLQYPESLVIGVPTYTTVKCHVSERYVENRRVDRFEPELYRLIPKRNRMSTSWMLEFPFDDNVQIILGDDLHTHLLWVVTLYFRGHQLELNLPEFNPRYKIAPKPKRQSTLNPTRFEREPVI